METRIVVFLLVVAAILAAGTAWLGRRLITVSGLGARSRRVLWLLLWLCPLAGLLSFVAGRVVERSQVTNLINVVGFTGLGILGTLAPFVLVRDLLLAPGWLRRRLRRGRNEAEADDALSRRAFLTRMSGRAIAGVSAATVAGGFVQAARGPEVVEVSVPIRDLPAALEGYRIAQVSDLHVGPVLDRAWLAEVVAMVNALEPQLIAVTGDLVDGHVAEIAPLLEPLRDLRAEDGTYFVTGNHEYYWNAPAWIGAVEALGLRVLGNAHTLVERDGARLLVAGVHDHAAKRILPAHASDPAAALEGAPPADLRLLLAHQPRSLHAAREHPFDLMLSGHTHGGQFFPWNLLLHLIQPAVAGLHRFGDLQVYVNRGTGWWGPPMRSPARSEVTLLRLTRAV